MVLGHEVALTVVQVGANLQERFHVGERFIMQADIYYKGVGLAYGYALPGGLSQYNVVGKEILDGDEGCYLLPVKPETGLCPVGADRAVGLRRGRSTTWTIARAGAAGGTVLIVGGPAARARHPLGQPCPGGQPPA